MAYLRGYISDSQTTLQVDDTTELPTNGGVVQIESEKIRYTHATDKALLGCERGYNGTSGATHADKKQVTLLTTAVAEAHTLELTASGAPTDSLTGVGFAPVGTRYIDSDDGTIYYNSGDSDNPVWEQVTIE